MSNTNKKINLNLDSQLLTKLKIISFINNQKLSQTIQQFLETQLSSFQKQNPKLNLNQFSQINQST